MSSKEKSQQDFSEFDFHDSSSDNSSAHSPHFLNRNRIDAVATPLSPPAAVEPQLNVVVVRPPTPLKMVNGGGIQSGNESSIKGDGDEDEEDDDDEEEDELLEDGSINKTKTLNVAVKQSTNSSRSKRDSSSSKNVRHQHQIFSKNIYIGTKNAEKWEKTRSRLAFKNDVEFVTYLLNLTDSELGPR